MSVGRRKLSSLLLAGSVCLPLAEEVSGEARLWFGIVFPASGLP